MTERKPPEMTFRSWIDQQISEAAGRGAFDNLTGAGKPLPNKPDPDGLGWLRDYVRREGISAEELLPTPLKLRKRAHQLAQTAQSMRSEQEVRDAAAELNRQIMEWRRIPLGPPVFVPLVDAESLVRTWREARPVPPPPRHAAVADRAPDQQKPRRWWRRREGLVSDVGTMSDRKGPKMPMFMDFHDDLKLPPAALDQIAQGTREGATDEFGVRQVELYHNADGKVYCLLEGPDEEAIRKHHGALNVPCGDVHEVSGLL